MTRKELASRLGISGAMVSKLAKRGMPCHDVETARRWRDRHLEPSRRKEARPGAAAGLPLAAQPPATGAPTAPAPAAGLDFHAARTLRENNEAELAGLRLAELRGELVRADDVRAALARRAVQFREGLLQIPARLAAVLAAEGDQATVHRRLDDEIRACLTVLCDAVSGGTAS